MLDLATQLFQDRPRPFGVDGFGAHQSKQLALPRRSGGAAYRTFDESPAFDAHL
jgi:hypothetical protein